MEFNGIYRDWHIISLLQKLIWNWDLIQFNKILQSSSNLYFGKIMYLPRQWGQHKLGMGISRLKRNKFSKRKKILFLHFPQFPTPSIPSPLDNEKCWVARSWYGHFSIFTQTKLLNVIFLMSFIYINVFLLCVKPAHEKIKGSYNKMC
jgi:hypothetical protein